MVSGTIVHSCVSVNTLLCSAGILILGRVWKCMREEQGSLIALVRWYTELLMVPVQVSFYGLVKFTFP